jgi:RNA polymerase sigma-54 factor
MRFETHQQMQLGQHMKLSPRMIQSMEILQMPMLALQERIEQELESNVALEQVEPGLDLQSGEGETGTDTAPRDGDAEFERLNEYEKSYSEAFDNEYSSQHFNTSRQAGERDKKMDAMANIQARAESLTDQLLHQWTFAETEPDIEQVGRKLIEFIDDDGLLATDLETIRAQFPTIPDVEVTTEVLERALRELQFWLDPPGIAARDVREALLLQIDDCELRDESEVNRWDDVRLLIEGHLDDLLQNRLPRISQKTSLDMDRIQAAMLLMRQLKPKPGRGLVNVDVPPIIPDVVVEYDEHRDEYVAGLRNGLLPTLRINDRYEVMARDRQVEKTTRDFVANNVRSATWLIESIAQRNSTLLRVVNVVLGRQRGFFDEGPQALKPLPMTEVADQLGVDVSTVSRAVADKWMQTPRGVFPLRRFFSGGTSTDSGQDMSWDAIKAILQEIVDGEDKSKPHSDEALSRELKKRGIDIARRTVVKYRQQLDIPPARRRKTF